MLPIPLPTLRFAAAPVKVQAPPVGAEPNPFVTVRLNWSDTNVVVGGAVTVTLRVVEPVCPPLSVTVRPTVLLPAVAYVWFVVCPLPVVPSPKSQA